MFCFLAAFLGLVWVGSQLFLRRGKYVSPRAGRIGSGRNLLQIAKVPSISVAPSATVMDAIKTMKTEQAGAVLVIDGDELKGIFTERDVLLRVALRRKDPETTPVSEVMTSPVVAVSNSIASDEALTEMAKRRVRHLPVVGSSGRIEGMLSIRHLLREKAENLEGDLDSLVAYHSADGIGG